jgi:ferredoxin--NADP+ reductase
MARATTAGRKKNTMNLREFDISNQFSAALVSSERITDPEADAEVRHLIFEMPPNQKFEFVEGQSLAVLVPGPHEFGNRHHMRLYSIASPRCGEHGRRARFSLCVRRCFYIDEISGERYPGKASNFLCDMMPGDVAQMAGPYYSAFSMPDNDTANLLMVGVGTGIAPFRAFIRHIYEERHSWKGQVRLFYGANTGMELLYRNDYNRDLALYYDYATFKAFETVSPRPQYDVPPDMDRLLEENSAEIWNLIRDPKTFVYVAGLIDVEHKFYKAMCTAAGSEMAWRQLRERMISDDRYAELLYE